MNHFRSHLTESGGKAALSASIEVSPTWLQTTQESFTISPGIVLRNSTTKFVAFSEAKNDQLATLATKTAVNCEKHTLKVHHFYDGKEKFKKPKLQSLELSKISSTRCHDVLSKITTSS